MRRRLSYANVTATLALVLSLGGGAYAATQINGSQIKDRTVVGKKLKLHTITANEVGNGIFVRSCQAGPVHGFARVIASPAFSSSYTAAPAAVDPGLKFNCAGGSVKARRVSAGVYYVNFAPNV